MADLFDEPRTSQREQGRDLSPLPKRFPIIEGGSVHWLTSAQAHDEYRRRYPNQPHTLLRILERGGFTERELDECVPGWPQSDAMAGKDQ